MCIPQERPTNDGNQTEGTNPASPSLPRTRDGRIKSRLSWEEKLQILDPHSAPKATEARLIEFAKLLAFRVSKASITKVGKGPRAWTSLVVPLTLLHIARHLLADQVPTLPPQWIASRSLSTSVLMAIDVDSDRTPGAMLNAKRDLLRDQTMKPIEAPDDPLRQQVLSKPADYKAPFAQRNREVLSALRLLGLNPRNPREVLVQHTPSGGRHYYVFFDTPNHLDQYRALLEAAGLRHIPGQIEFFPSTSQGLRLPFGFIPGRTHDPTAWIQFIDDFSNGRIRRFSLQTLYENLTRRTETSNLDQEPSDRQSRPTKPKSGSEISEGNRILHGTPKHVRVRPAPLTEPPGLSMEPSLVEHSADHYLRIIQNRPQSREEAKILWKAGIQIFGTRTQILKHLAAHLIWFKNVSSDQAAKLLTQWAMDPRHQSRDIQSDLRDGTAKVTGQIAEICRWHGERKASPNLQVQPSVDSRPRFAPSELCALHDAIQSVPPNERRDLSHFLLSFLGFAKSHGKPAEDGSGWIASADVKAVIRRWPGCQHMNYRYRMQLAMAARVFTLVKEKWQRPGGGGRPRTYLLNVPITPSEAWTQSYEMALKSLISITSPQHPTEEERTRDHVSSFPREFIDERRFDDINWHPDEHSVDKGPLYQRSAQGTLGEASHQRNPERTQTEKLSDPPPEGCPTIPTGIGMRSSRRHLQACQADLRRFGLNSEPHRELPTPIVDRSVNMESMKQALLNLRTTYIEARLRNEGLANLERPTPQVPVNDSKDDTTRGP